jgi:hypothetical protein
LRECRWPQDRIGEVVLALDEVVTNSVVHAYGGAGGRFGLSAEVVVPFFGMLTATFAVRGWGRWGPPGSGSRGTAWRSRTSWWTRCASTPAREARPSCCPHPSSRWEMRERSPAQIFRPTPQNSETSIRLPTSIGSGRHIGSVTTPGSTRSSERKK